MHMADALLSPATAGVMWAASAAALAWACRRVRQRAEDRLVPLMGMLGAFVFSAQMVNFSIPATGSSAHLCGGLLLAVLLGPPAAMLVMASVLTVQALFFADGGLLALGANFFNLALLPCGAAYALVYRPLAGSAPSPRRAAVAVLPAALVGVLLGAGGVVLQTGVSQIAELPPRAFAALMLPVHLGIGLCEGLVTAALLLLLARTQPGLLLQATRAPAAARRPLLARVALASVLTGGVLSMFASTQPDGLEWAVAHAAHAPSRADTTPALATPAAPQQGLHAVLGDLQQRSAVMAGYALPTAPAGEAPSPGGATAPNDEPAPVSRGAAGLLGGAITIAWVFAVGALLRARQRRA